MGYSQHGVHFHSDRSRTWPEPQQAFEIIWFPSQWWEFVLTDEIPDFTIEEMHKQLIKFIVVNN